uniref:Uncharacterized protein n=1 Tax=Cacopsylla melanoneura TaxID=428564 RepID=A0A8D8UBZ9_9HEMI
MCQWKGGTGVPRHHIQLGVSPVQPSLCSTGLLAVNQLGGRFSAQLERSNYCLLVSKQPAPCNPNTTGSSEGSGLVSSTLGRWTDPSISSTLSSDPVILKTLKGIQALRPRQEGRRIWDVDQLRQWIYRNPPSLSNFLEISRHVATLLLLVSGRRVHDLTLLLVTEDRLQRIPPDRVFWPAFDSKTDSNSRSQSGWRLSPNTSEPLWNIVHWIDQLSALFISTRGSVKPASRAIIVNWAP